MSAPDRFDDDALTVLLEGDARVADPMRMAAAIEELAAAAPPPPLDLRERVAGTLGVPAPRPRRRRWRPALAVGGLACLAIAGVLMAGRSSHPRLTGRDLAPTAQTVVGQALAPIGTAHVAHGSAVGDSVIPVERGRLQHYEADLTLRVPSQRALAHATQQALAITRRLGGYLVTVDYGTARVVHGAASLDVRVPVARVQAEIARLSQLGTITAQHVAIADLQAQHDVRATRIDGLRETIALLGARLQDPTLHAEQRVQLLSRRFRAQRTLGALLTAQRALEHRAAYASVALRLRTAQAASPTPTHARASAAGRAARDALHLLARAGVAAIYAAILLAPLAVLALLGALAARALRRRNERRLLQI